MELGLVIVLVGVIAGAYKLITVRMRLDKALNANSQAIEQEKKTALNQLEKQGRVGGIVEIKTQQVAASDVIKALGSAADNQEKSASENYKKNALPDRTKYQSQTDNKELDGNTSERLALGLEKKIDIDLITDQLLNKNQQQPEEVLLQTRKGLRNDSDLAKSERLKIMGLLNENQEKK